MGGSKRGRSGGPRWLNDGKHNSAVAVRQWRRKKGVAPWGGGCALFIAARDGWQWWRELRLGALAAHKLWQRVRWQSAWVGAVVRIGW
jgi:hypothetical protein